MTEGQPLVCRLAQFKRRQRIEVAGHPLWIASKEDLVLSKLDWVRQSQSQRQLSDVENLLATGDDMKYLETWSQKLNLTDMLTRVFPKRMANELGPEHNRWNLPLLSWNDKVVATNP